MLAAKNLAWRLIYAATLAAVFLGALWIGQQFWPHAASKPLPEALQKYLGRKDYPPAAEADPRTKSGPSLDDAIRATGGDVDGSKE